MAAEGSLSFASAKHRFVHFIRCPFACLLCHTLPRAAPRVMLVQYHPLRAERNSRATARFEPGSRSLVAQLPEKLGRSFSGCSLLQLFHFAPDLVQCRPGWSVYHGVAGSGAGAPRLSVGLSVCLCSEAESGGLWRCRCGRSVYLCRRDSRQLRTEPPAALNLRVELLLRGTGSQQHGTQWTTARQVALRKRGSCPWSSNRVRVSCPACQI
jgi:hypothetical protein